jgi:hypothetical protein
VNNPRGLFEVKAMKASLKQVLQMKPRRQAILKSIEAEINNQEQPGVLSLIRYRNIPKEYSKDIIGVYMFHKEKFEAVGSFDKNKYRIVLLSNKRDPSKIGETTVNPISVTTQLNLAAVNRDYIKGKFLLTQMQKGVRMFIKGVQMSRCNAKCLHDDGCLYFELKRYVYVLRNRVSCVSEIRLRCDRALGSGINNYVV